MADDHLAESRSRCCQEQKLWKSIVPWPLMSMLLNVLAAKCANTEQEASGGVKTLRSKCDGEEGHDKGLTIVLTCPAEGLKETAQGDAGPAPEDLLSTTCLPRNVRLRLRGLSDADALFLRIALEGRLPFVPNLSSLALRVLGLAEPLAHEGLRPFGLNGSFRSTLGMRFWSRLGEHLRKACKRCLEPALDGRLCFVLSVSSACHLFRFASLATMCCILSNSSGCMTESPRKSYIAKSSFIIGTHSASAG